MPAIGESLTFLSFGAGKPAWACPELVEGSVLLEMFWLPEIVSCVISSLLPKGKKFLKEKPPGSPAVVLGSFFIQTKYPTPPSIANIKTTKIIFLLIDI
jgi:hypothetical protein